MKNPGQSIQVYEKAYAIDSNYIPGYVRLSYSISLAEMGQFQKALHSVNSIFGLKEVDERTLKAAGYRKRSFEFAVDFENKHKDKNYVFTPKNLGDGVNTAEAEYFPSISIEGNKLIFTRLLNNRNEDFFGTIKNGDKWEKAQQLKCFINTPENEGAQNVSQDGKWLVFTACHRPDGFGSCDLYISFETENGWSEPFFPEFKFVEIEKYISQYNGCIDLYGL